MGYDASAHTIIGLRIAPASNFYVKKLVKIGSHNKPPQVKFCAETGKKLWEERDVPLFDWEEESENPGSLEIFHPDSEGDRSPYIIIGKEFGSEPDKNWDGSNPKVSQLPPTSEVASIRTNIKAQIPTTLWDDSQFGLWSAIHHSY